MNSQAILIEDKALATAEVHLTESEQIWRFAGYYYGLFRRRRILIFLFCIAGAVLGYVYASSKKTRYVAELKFTSNIDNGSTNGYVSLAQQFGLISGTGGSSAFSGDNLMSLMKMPSLIDRTLFTSVNVKGQNKLLIDYYIESKNLKEKWKKSNPTLATAIFDSDLTKPDYLRDSTLKSLDKTIIAELSIDKSNKDLDFVSVKMTDSDSAVAKLFVETLVKTVTDFYVGITTAKYMENVKVFQNKADSLGRNFSMRLSSIAATQDINVNPTKQISNVPLQKQRMNVEADNAIYQEVIKNLEFAKLQLQKSTPFIQVIESPRYPLDEVKTSKLSWTTIGFLLGGFIVPFFLLTTNELKLLVIKLKKYSK